MSLFRRTHAEMVGAWRSLRYDLGRRPAEPSVGGPDVTSTGMYTFGVEIPDEPPAGPAGARRLPRRAAAVTALGLLTVAGTAGAYLAIANGLGAVLHETPAAADAFPRRAAPPAAAPAPNAGIGRGPVTTAGSTAVAHGAAPAGGAALPTEAAATGGTARTGGAALTAGHTATAPVPGAPHSGPVPIRTVQPTSTECDCPGPPVPTPTAPSTSPSPTPSAEPTPVGSAEPSASSVTPGDSPEASDSAQSWQDRHGH